MNLTSYEWIENEDTGKRTMLVHYLVDGREKTISVKKIATIIEALLPETTTEQAELPFGGNGHELA